jgi:GNAT superfamily N-acetyltransferase
MQVELKAPTTDADWGAYHAIRRRVLFELRGNGSAYDEHHPDETRPGHHPLVFWVGATPVGTIRIDVGGSRAIFRRVAIREDLQRRGYGRQLLEAAEQFARQHCARIESHVDPDAVGFYERCGFRHADSAGGIRSSSLMIKDLDVPNA